VFSNPKCYTAHAEVTLTNQWTYVIAVRNSKKATGRFKLVILSEGYCELVKQNQIAITVRNS